MATKTYIITDLFPYITKDLFSYITKDQKVFFTGSSRKVRLSGALHSIGLMIINAPLNLVFLL